MAVKPCCNEARPADVRIETDCLLMLSLIYRNVTIIVNYTGTRDVTIATIAVQVVSKGFR